MKEVCIFHILALLIDKSQNVGMNKKNVKKRRLIRQAPLFVSDILRYMTIILEFHPEFVTLKLKKLRFLLCYNGS